MKGLPGWYEITSMTNVHVVRWWDGEHWWYDRECRTPSGNNIFSSVRLLGGVPVAALNQIVDLQVELAHHNSWESGDVEVNGSRGWFGLSPRIAAIRAGLQ